MEKKNATGLVIAVGILALVVGCTLGALLGGAATYLMTTSSTRWGVPEPSIKVSPEFRLPVAPVTPQAPIQRMGSTMALVTAVTPDSPAERAGLLVGDMITGLDANSIQGNGLATMVAAYDPGDSISLNVQRGTEELILDVTLGENPDTPGTAWLGITYQMMPDGMQRFIRPNGD